MNVRLAGLGRIGNDAHHVRIEDVRLVASRHDQVLVPVEIDIQKPAGPRPLARVHPGELGYLRVGVIAAVELQGVPRELRLKPGVCDWQIQFPAHGVGPLRLAEFTPHGEHVGHKKIVVSVPVDVGEIDGHG